MAARPGGNTAAGAPAAPAARTSLGCNGRQPSLVLRLNWPAASLSFITTRFWLSMAPHLMCCTSAATFATLALMWALASLLCAIGVSFGTAHPVTNLFSIR